MEEPDELQLGVLLAWPNWLYRLAKATDELAGAKEARDAQIDAASNFQMWARPEYAGGDSW
jgi:hypothetical protein